MSKKRLDELLVERNLIEDIDKAKRIIMAGLVFNEQERLDKPGMKIDENITLTVKGKSIPYVGRGGLKLEKALKVFNISAEGKILIDVGSSTGGFTDCALQHGAKLSYAIDVGYNQLDWKLRNDARVVVMERTNFRYVTPDMLIKGTPNFASVDVSFISIKKILPVLNQLLAPQSDVVVLIKPQFEARKEQVGEKGIINDKNVHLEVLREVIAFATDEQYELINLTFSPITGGEGNIEFLAHLGWKTGYQHRLEVIDQIDNIVEDAHTSLK
jgi:23S rRNA (cytidine1920-2'-O)/16S rRNA (cytidine1409-2'-O)-methyltransferase